MVTPVIKYPLDETGVAATNLIVGEIHNLSTLTQKAFVLNYGPFYTLSLVVRNAANGQVLTPKTQYVATQLFVDMTLRTGLDICSIIVITDPTLPTDLEVSVDYQLLGGEYSASVDAIQQLIDSLSLGAQPILWADIIGKPVIFPPTPHLHDAGDIYGFEYIVAAMERLVQAIYVGDAAQLQAIYQYIDHQIGVVEAEIAARDSNLTAHLSDFNNPHRVTQTQVGLGSVSNYVTAVIADGQIGTASNKFMTPQVTTAAIASQVGNAFNAHVGNVSNPHQVTATQVGLGAVNNYGWASTADAQTGTATNGYMNAALTSAAIATQALAPLNAHVSNLSNPHNVTKSQIGLGSVNNYGTASSNEGITGTSGSLYMTPAATTATVNALAVTPLNAHINNHNNPHLVSTGQLGLDNVNNTADVNKPVSTAQQAALDAKASIGSAPRFAALAIGADADIYIYESSTNTLSFRTGGAGAYAYTTISANGDLYVSGKVIAGGGFRPSDRRLKKSICKADPRPLWQKLQFKSWLWKEDGRFETGVIAQEVFKVAPEYTTLYDSHNRKNIMAVDKTSMAFEIGMAAGRAIDKLHVTVAKQAEELKKLKSSMKSLLKGS